MQVVKEPKFPKDWNITKIKNEFKITHGKLPKKIFGEKGNDRLPYLITNSLNGQSNEFANKTDGVLVENDDIIIIGDGNGSGRCYFGKRGILSSTFLLLTNEHQKITNEFVYLYLKLNYQFFNNTKYGSGIPHIDQYLLREFQIPVPPLLEQQQIASILSNIDDTIQKTDQIIEQTQRLKNGMMQKLLTKGIGHTKFKKVKWFFGKEIEIPEKWEIKKMKDLSEKIVNGTTPKGGKKVYVENGIVFLRSQNVWKNRLLLDEVAHIDDDTHAKMMKSSLKNKDILITKTGRINTENSSLGRAAMFLGKDNSANINGHVYLIRLREKIIPEFVLSIITTNEYREYIRSVCVGGIDKRQINKEHLEKFPIVLPPIKEQQQIASILSNIETQIQKEKLHKSNLERLKKGLMQKLLTGQIRVKVK